MQSRKISRQHLVCVIAAKQTLCRYFFCGTDSGKCSRPKHFLQSRSLVNRSAHTRRRRQRRVDRVGCGQDCQLAVQHNATEYPRRPELPETILTIYMFSTNTCSPTSSIISKCVQSRSVPTHNDRMPDRARTTEKATDDGRRTQRELARSCF